MLTLTTPDYSSPEWECLPGDVRQEVRDLLHIIRQAPRTGLTAWLQNTARDLGISYPSLRRKYYHLRNEGGDWKILIDLRKVPVMRAAMSKARQPLFAAHLSKLAEQNQRKNAPAFKALRRQWTARRLPIPGYEDWPGWPQVPAGWTDANLARILQEHNNLARLRSVRVGTSSKTNTYLPTVLTTRTGLWQGAVIQLDDVWHDNLVTLGKKREIVRVLEIGALDLFSASRFHWGAKPRRRREGGSYETLAGKDMRLFLAGMFHRFGFCPRGTMLMSEHQTAKVDEDIARILYDYSGGLIRVDYQPIEGKQAALSGFWSGTEGGNFRAKACLESSHNLIHNDLANLPMQTGSHSSGLQGPVTTDRIQKYIERTLRDVLAKVPHRGELLRLPTWDFHTHFVPFLTDYYEFGLNGRTDHDLEGWEKLGHAITEYTTVPGSGHFFPEETFLSLPPVSQTAIRAAAQADPAAWTNRRNLSPNEVWQRREKFTPLHASAICDMIGGDMAREVTAARGFLEFSDQEIAPDPLIYQARYVCGPHHGREIPHGRKVRMFAMPFDDATAIVVDAKDRYLGEVALYQRVCPIDPAAFHAAAPYEARPDIRSAALTRAAGEKHSRIADILEPSRILHADRVQEARDLRDHNRDVIAGKPVTPDEIAAARSDARHAGNAARFGRAVQSSRTPSAPPPQDHCDEDWSAPLPPASDETPTTPPTESW